MAELLLGTWAFIYGAFHPARVQRSSSPIQGLIPAAFHQPPLISHFNANYRPPPFVRAIFTHASTDEWRDTPGFNAYCLRAAFPALTVEVQRDWEDRVLATVPATPSETRAHEKDETQQNELGGERAWHFPTVMLADRSAAHRGIVCGGQTQRTAAEAWHFMAGEGALDQFGEWWSSIRNAILAFADADIPSLSQEEETEGNIHADIADAHSHLVSPQNIVITYISRQGGHRHLIEEDHIDLVLALQELVKRKQSEGNKWQLNVVQAERISKDEQVQLIARTTVR